MPISSWAQVFMASRPDSATIRAPLERTASSSARWPWTRLSRGGRRVRRAPGRLGWPCQLQGGPDEDELGTDGDEPVDERLSKSPVDVAGAARRVLVAIASRQVDVDVEPVLM
jgi:hypothetical protein